ncbi:thaumatin family protein [Methylolobus aquaticus]
MKSLITIALGGLLLAQSQGAHAVSHVTIQYANPVAPTYVYRCDDAACTTQKQISYVTVVPAQQGLPSIAPLSFFRTGGIETTYAFFQHNPKTQHWNHCKLTIKGDGTVNTGATTCSGAGVIPASSTAAVSVISLGANFAAHPTAAPLPAPKTRVLTAARQLTFRNDTRYRALCINGADQFNDMRTGRCTGTGDRIVRKGRPRVIDVPERGINSGAWFVTGFQTSQGHWFNTGRDAAGNIYSIVMEPTFYPTDNPPTGSGATRYSASDHSVGVTNIDSSLVDGYNFGLSIRPSKPTICSHVNARGITRYTLYGPQRDMTGLLSERSRTAGHTLKSVCPEELLVNKTGAFKGCYSNCTHAKKHGAADADLVCCAGAYSQKAECISQGLDHNALSYVESLHVNSVNTYTWAYDDTNGDFACDPNGSFTFAIMD